MIGHGRSATHAGLAFHAYFTAAYILLNPFRVFVTVKLILLRKL